MDRRINAYGARAKELAILSITPRSLKMFTVAFTLLLSASSAFAAAVNTTIVPRACGSTLSNVQVQAMEADFQAALSKQPIAALDVGIQACSIPVYWHVINAGTSRQPSFYAFV